MREDSPRAKTIRFEEREQRLAFESSRRDEIGMYRKNELTEGTLSEESRGIYSANWTTTPFFLSYVIVYLAEGVSSVISSSGTFQLFQSGILTCVSTPRSIDRAPPRLL